MGIKTFVTCNDFGHHFALKNLPTTWGLRRHKTNLYPIITDSEKPPRHSGIIQR